MFRRLFALWLLALGLVKTLLLRLSPVRPLRGFEARYGREGIFAVTPREATLLAEAGRCTACGRCDAEEGERIATSRTGYRGMAAFAMTGTRSLPDFSSTARTMAEVPSAAIVRAESLCPYKVPLQALVRLVVDHAERSERRVEPPST
jgi:ferredoxin